VTGAVVRTEQRKRLSLPSGWWGMALFIGAEATLFGTLVATYFYFRFSSVKWPPAGVPEPKVALPLILTGVLVASTVPVFFGSRAARSGRVRATWLFFFVALLIQGGYLGVQVHEFTSDLARFSPQDTAYASIYFTLIGVHHVHVAVGMLLELWVLGKLLGGLTSYRLTGVRVTAFYWYFVATAAVAVVLTQVYPAL
jgi:heme/copper-type cytochrome/quinol oxidase subunit 3